MHVHTRTAAYAAAFSATVVVAMTGTAMAAADPAAAGPACTGSGCAGAPPRIAGLLPTTPLRPPPQPGPTSPPAGVMAAAARPAAAPPAPRDCPDFATQAQAQAALDHAGVDPRTLDSDGDGTACERWFSGR